MFNFCYTVNFLVKKNFSLLYQKRSLNVTRASLQTFIIRGLQQKSCSVNESTIDHTEKKPFTMKLDTPEFKSLFTQALCHLATIFKQESYELRIAGGAVRDLLLGVKPKDVDFATTATPEEMKYILAKNDVKMINNKGEKHGTITARIDQQNFEITTLRIDVETDGRHAEVEFTTDWKLDAGRRDLTVNSMFLGLDGTLYDYFNGYDDLMKRRIAFVGSPALRIREDYLRILRYFRFYGRIADKPDNHDQECLKVIQENADGLKRISGERIWMELQKIVVGNFAGDILKVMHKVGLFPYIALPANPNFEELDTVMNNTKNVKVHPITHIVPLLHTVDEMMIFHTRCKLSSYERDLGIFIIQNRNDPAATSIHYKKLVVYMKVNVQDAKNWVMELLKYKNQINFINEIQMWNVPRFPLSGHQLMEAGVPGGKRLGLVIDNLKLLWADSEFKLTDKDLMEHLPEVMNELGIKKVAKK